MNHKKIYQSSFMALAMAYGASAFAADVNGAVDQLAGDVNGLSKDLAGPVVHVAGDTLLLAGGGAEGVGGATIEAASATGAFAVSNVEGLGHKVNAVGDTIEQDGVAGLPVVNTVAGTVTGLTGDLLDNGTGNVLGTVTGTVDGLTGDLLGGDALAGVTDTAGGLLGGVTGSLSGSASGSASASAGDANASASASTGLLGTGLLAN